uniref:WSC domain-containing protein n=1 Tax=Lotharella globosa TaxID=91324 RepID=A0A7S3YUL5_9EUKA|mmetsp:Transcript_19305/g.37300  ORF Transcript_19305/g.37300 Transcript_19305/m.37300 type:complete len:523 (-) Transcript_19305:259-1827(-)|eukprot:CAMPEP_0167795688 /NCGR_PEP_ID=MMETSP0111_2-20121227/14591_1 /TAXON_ID=91324 /ORGANISM="Lotharella globosa, Strain CCCM811" /LENGTH=522 /DNA_ID=CAMNT_0007689417 /DNA_START=106 /DNA_END=1674 /DNA_ORIENTATION=+
MVTIKRKARDEEKGEEQKDKTASVENKTSSLPSSSTTSSSQSASDATTASRFQQGSIWLVVAVVGWFLVVYKGAQLTRKHGLHYPVANYLGIGLGPSPLIPGIAYSIMSDNRNKLLVCNKDSFCSQVAATRENVALSCFTASEILDGMDDKGGLTHSRVFFLAYVCPGSNYGKWVSYSMEDEPYKKALRLKLYDKKEDASPWRLYKDKEGHKLQCFLDGPGKDHWIGAHPSSGQSILVPHADSSGHSAFVFAMVADQTPSVRLTYAMFHEAAKGFLTCDDITHVCKVVKKQSSVGNSCWKLDRQSEAGSNTNDEYIIQYNCQGPSLGWYLSTLKEPTRGDVHVGLSKDTKDKWRIHNENSTGTHITLITGDYKGYRLGPGGADMMHKKEFYFVRRTILDRLEEEEDDAPEENKKEPSKIEEARASVSKYSTDDYKFIGCYHDKWVRDLPKGPRKWGYTHSTCMNACSGFLYFGLQGGSWCSCGNSYGKHGKALDDDCLKMKGDKEEMTGGEFRNAIFEISGK